MNTVQRSVLPIPQVPRWLALFGFVTGLVLLFTAGYVPWLELVFPVWVFVLSMHILLTTFPAQLQVDVTDHT